MYRQEGVGHDIREIGERCQAVQERVTGFVRLERKGTQGINIFFKNQLVTALFFSFFF